MSELPATVKIVIAGSFAAGKTTFIKSVSDILTTHTETPVSDGARPGKTETTVAMDHGRLRVPGRESSQPIDLMLFGAPGQERFDFMWRILARGALGYVLLVDASDEASWEDTVAIDATFSVGAGLPRVVGVNRHPPDQDLAEFRDLLGIEPGVPVLSCDPRDRSSARDLLLVLLEGVLRTHGGVASPAAAPVEGGR